MQEATIEGPTSPTEVYICDLYVMNLVEDGPQVTCMTTEGWKQAQLADPILGQVIAKMQDGPLGQCPYKLTNASKLLHLLQECNHLKLRQGILYRKVLLKRVPGGTVSVGIASHSQRDCFGRMPWWYWPLRPQKNAQPDAQPFRLALNGCTGKGPCCKMLPVLHLQGKTAEGSHVKYCCYPSPGAGAHQLPVPGARERNVEECLSGDWPLYQVHQGICYSIKDGPDNGQDIVEQIHCPLWAAGKDPFGPREKLWEWTNCPPLQVDQYQEA